MLDMSSIDPTPAVAAAEAAWRRVVDAQAADLVLLFRRWPDRESPDSQGAIARLHRRRAPGGDADQALAALETAYGGPDAVPAAVRQRLDAYVETQLGRAPWRKEAGDAH